MSFWNEPELEPKRNFRFKLLDGASTTWWWSKSIDKPSFDVSNNEYQLINHKFKYPGIVTWKPISISVVDVGDVVDLLMSELETMGYINPSSGTAMTGLSKNDLGFINNLSIQQLDEEGKIIENWKLYGSFITSISFSKLDYGNDDLTEITIEVAYDYATFDIE